MIEVCKTISMLDYEWYQENELNWDSRVRYRYRICCRQIVQLEHRKHITEMRLQLYKVQEHAYLLDFQKMQGNVCSFMHMCGTVIDQLQKGLSRNAQLMGDVCFEGVICSTCNNERRINSSFCVM